MRGRIALLLLLLSGFAWAGPEGHLVAHISGGVGLEERETMLARRGEFNVHLVFAAQRGNYLAGVETILAEEDGVVVLKLMSDGPFVYAKLNPGRYTVAATFRGETQVRRFTVDAKQPSDITLLWKDP